MAPAKKRQKTNDPQADDDSFDYESVPLGVGEIRKLELLAADSKDEPLAARLIADEPGNEGYEAVSYTWESDEKPCTVRIGSRAIRIGKNLDAALRQFRKTDGARRLWVDAVCIDQTNSVERTAQVAMMTRLYQHARRTLTWLGPEGGRNDGRAAIGFFKWLLLHDRERRQLENGSGTTTLKMILKKYNTYAMPDARIDSTKLLVFCERRYFKRRWILQEVGVARDSQFWCGTTSIGGQDLADAASSLLIHESPLPISSGFMRFMSISKPEKYHASGKKKAREDDDDSIEMKSLRALGAMERFREFDCSDGRDRIASLAWVDEKSDLFSLNYQSSTEEVFVSFASSIVTISQHCLASALSSSARRRHAARPTLPSWVPDWRVLPFDRGIKVRIVKQESKSPHTVRLLRQAGDSHWKGELSGSTLKLSLEGFHESKAVVSSENRRIELQHNDTIIIFRDDHPLRFNLTGTVRAIVLRDQPEGCWRIVTALEIRVTGQNATLVDIELNIV